jgi:hypothetical protein
MEPVLSYRGRQVSEADVVFVRELIAQHPEASRRQLSAKLCEAWGWRQPNGKLRDQVCRSLMLELHRAGHIELPPVRFRPPNPLAQRARPAPVELDRSPIRCSLRELGELELRQIRREPDAAPRHLRPRDRHLGWSAEQRRANLRLVAYNTRYLIMPWVQVRHLASHVLGRVGRQLSDDWQQLYGHPIYFVETFVFPERHRGTCYYAANWRWLGRTTGRGHNASSWMPTRPRKDVLGLALHKRFRELLSTMP